jgi:mannitol/fructose-specific phosphotransferase system IIA component (Ntr-type)
MVMKLSDVYAGAVVLNCEPAPTRDEVIRLLLDRLAKAGRLDPDVVPEVLARVLQRELLGSTAIGGGVALPHARHPAAPGPLRALAVSKQGIATFDSLDGEPVYLVLLWLDQPDSPGTHRGDRRAWFRLFESLSRYLRCHPFRRSLFAANTSEEIAAVLRAADEGEFDHSGR